MQHQAAEHEKQPAIALGATAHRHLEHDDGGGGDDECVKRAFEGLICKGDLARGAEHEHGRSRNEGEVERKFDPNTFFKSLHDWVGAVHLALFP